MLFGESGTLRPSYCQMFCINSTQRIFTPVLFPAPEDTNIALDIHATFECVPIYMSSPAHACRTKHLEHTSYAVACRMVELPFLHVHTPLEHGKGQLHKSQKQADPHFSLNIS
mmetsp:Transcript_53630/g.96376  ORF Transcript_53630/g.96376 Transcript_53630/m.96376 type:complete len:113 (+) Transcript_53630:85-423(+)